MKELLTKAELVAAIAEKAELSKKDSEKALQAFKGFKLAVWKKAAKLTAGVPLAPAVGGREIWFKIRENLKPYFGASAAPKLIRGYFGSPRTVAEEMLGIRPRPQQNERMEWGSKIEDLIRQKAEEVLGAGLTSCPVFLGWSEDSTIGAEPDFLGVDDAGSLFVGDCKFVDSNSDPAELVANYAPQLQQQMLVCGAKRAYLAVLFGNRHFEIFEVAEDAAMQADIVATWGAVRQALNGGPLPSLSAFDLKEQKEKERLPEKAVDLSSDERAAGLRTAYLAAKAAAKAAADEADAAQAQLLEYLGDCTSAQLPEGGKYNYSVSEVHSLDSAVIKASFPEAAAAAEKVTIRRNFKIS